LSVFRAALSGSTVQRSTENQKQTTKNNPTDNGQRATDNAVQRYAPGRSARMI
jgi:hypothetical protein